ncbi:hypothetical protein [Chitinimonas sp. BJB300]|uniref:hypothetical protein n=1 Tax=Chitinimonas sp. BJB300 TaxID=1559339 RepID=UPI000C11DC35|nr:hypothetical protein [Chitinimonas sp. BJB300]PHV11257.1 hypothetical protein CSQ89_11765 [Chitinimonas sp. BJB300]
MKKLFTALIATSFAAASFGVMAAETPAAKPVTPAAVPAPAAKQVDPVMPQPTEVAKPAEKATKLAAKKHKKAEKTDANKHEKSDVKTDSKQ